MASCCSCLKNMKNYLRAINMAVGIAMILIGVLTVMVAIQGYSLNMYTYCAILWFPVFGLRVAVKFVIGSRYLVGENGRSDLEFAGHEKGSSLQAGG